MIRKDLLAFCKYYKGENENPYDQHPRAWYVWEIEKRWVEEMSIESHVTEWLSDILDRYIFYGYADIEKFDGTPIMLKAALFSLLEKWNEGMVTRDSFSAFYKRWRDCKL